MWKLNNTLLKIQRINEEIKEDIVLKKGEKMKTQ